MEQKETVTIIERCTETDEIVERDVPTENMKEHPMSEYFKYFKSVTINRA